MNWYTKRAHTFRFLIIPRNKVKLIQKWSSSFSLWMVFKLLYKPAWIVGLFYCKGRRGHCHCRAGEESGLSQQKLDYDGDQLWFWYEYDLINENDEKRCRPRVSSSNALPSCYRTVKVQNHFELYENKYSLNTKHTQYTWTKVRNSKSNC